MVWDGSKPPVAFLFSESHLKKDIIAENLQNACRLLDAGVVDLVAVEERFTTDPAEEVKQFVGGLGFASIEAYSDDLFQQLGDDAGIIAAAKANAGQMSFARFLLYLRPATVVVSIDDPHLATVAQLENQVIAQKQFADMNGAQMTGATLDRFRRGVFRHLEVNQQRELAFISRTYEAYAKRGASQGVIMNLGGYHHRHISRLFAMMGQPYVWVTPPSYQDAMP